MCGKSSVFIMVILVFALFFTACGSGEGEGSDTGGYDAVEIDGNVGGGLTNLLIPFTISAPMELGQLVQDAGDGLRDEMAARGIYIDLDIQLHTHEETGNHAAQMQALFSAGQAPDVFAVTDGLPLLSFMGEGYLADINELLETHSNRDYFFTNILDALQIGGNLYTFPLFFAFDFVGINANLPEEIIEMFSQYSGISYGRLAEFYREIRETYETHPEFEHMAMGFAADLRLRDSIHDWMNFSTHWGPRRFSSNNAFMPFMDNVRHALYGNQRHGTAVTPELAGNPASANMLALQSERYLFNFSTFVRDTANALLNFDMPYFIHYIPITGMTGNLLASRATHNLFAVNANTTGNMATAFLEHLAYAWTNSAHAMFSVYTPIKRAMFHEHTEAALWRAIDEPTTKRIGSPGHAVAAAIARLEEYVNMPVTIPASMFFLPLDIVDGIIDTALSDELTPRQSLDEIRDKMNYWLETGGTLEPDREWLEEQARMAARADLPVRTLSALIYYDFQNVMRQAAEEMNLAWARRGEPYNFELEVNAFGFTEIESTRARVSTMLMAGQGYDIMHFDRQPLNQWGRTGLLTDVWTLIDQDPETSRDDFHIHILEALAQEDGLWTFPISFGFDYIGIQQALPDSILSLFTGRETISVREVMEIYAELQANYSDEFGHLSFSAGGRTSIPAGKVLHELASFIDSNILDERFVSFLEALRSAHPVLRPSREFGIGGVTWEWERTLAGEFAFYVRNHHLQVASVLLPQHEDIYFTGFIPLTDEFGRLRVRAESLQHRSGNWLSLMYPTVGDSALAWEFTQYFIEAMVEPVGVAVADPAFPNVPLGVGRHCNATPIRRELFEGHLKAGLYTAVDWESRVRQHTGLESVFAEGVVNPATRQGYIDAAVERVAAYNRMPVVALPFFPEGLTAALTETIENFIRGTITTQAAAQDIHNRVSLWLIE